MRKCASSPGCSQTHFVAKNPLTSASQEQDYSYVCILVYLVQGIEPELHEAGKPFFLLSHILGLETCPKVVSFLSFLSVVPPVVGWETEAVPLCPWSPS